MSCFRWWGIPILLQAALLLTVSPAAEPRAAEPAVERGAGAYEAFVDASAVDSSLEWAGGAFILYLDSFVGAAAQRAPAGLQPFTVRVRLLTEEEDLIFLVNLEKQGVVIADGELRGEPGEAARWLTDLAVIIERAVFPARQSPVAWEPPTSSTDALRRFLEAGRSADFGEKERLLRGALAADPSFLEARWQLGVVQCALGGYEDVLDAFDTYLTARPSSPRAEHNSDFCAALVGRKREAAAEGGMSGAGSAEMKRLFLDLLEAPSPGVWMAGLPEISPVTQGRWIGQPSESVPGMAQKPVGGVPDLEERLKKAEGESERLRVENEGFRDQKRSLEELLREKDRQAIQLAKEALASQKSQRETAARVRNLEAGLGAQVQPVTGGGEELEALRKEEAAMRAELERVEGQAVESGREKEVLESRIAALEEELRSSGEEAEKARAEAGALAALQAERDALAEEGARLEERLAEQEKQAGDLEALRKEEATVRAELAEVKKQAGEYEKEKESLMRRQTDLESAREDLEAQVKERDGQLQGLLEEAGAFEGREVILSGEKEVLESRVAALEEELRSSGEEAEKARAEAGALTALQAERDALAEEKERLEERLAEQEKQVGDLESAREDLEAMLREARHELSAEHEKSAGLEREKEDLMLLRERFARKLREMTLRLMALEEVPGEREALQQRRGSGKEAPRASALP